MDMHRFTGQLIIFGLGIGWSIVFYLGKRTLTIIDRKMEENLKKVEKTSSGIAELVGRQRAEINAALKNLTASMARQVRALDKKITRQEEAQKKGMEKQCETCAGLYLTRQEFGAFTASTNHKIDSIYEYFHQMSRDKK